MTTERMNAILKSVSRRVEKLVPSARFYIALYDSRKNELSFPLVRDGDYVSTWDSRFCKSDSTLPDLVISSGKSLLCENDLLSRFEKDGIHYWPDGKDVPQSWLSVPINLGEQAFGALVVENWQKNYSFNKNDEATLVTVARQAAIAIENVRMYEQLEITNKQLKRKTENLKVLNDVGRQLASGLVKQEKEILEAVYEGLTKLQIDIRNMYIAFYDPNPNKLDTENDIHGLIRIGLARNIEQLSPMESRVARKGLTEYVIRIKKSFNPPNVQQAYEEFAPDSIRESRSPHPRSWLGVPVLLADQSLGAIVLRNYEFERVFTLDDQEILEILAGQVGAALHRLKLFEKEQKENEQRIAAERVSVMSMTAAEFVHKMNNLGGTIPVRVNLARAFLNADSDHDKKIIAQLNSIQEDTELMLRAAQEIQNSAKESAAEMVDVNELVEISSKRALHQIPTMDTSHVELVFLDHNLPKIEISRNTLLDTLTNIIKNGLDAIVEADDGIVKVETHCDDGFVKIVIQDNGKGISDSELPEIFKLFYTTKGPRGLGFGLWRDKTFIKRVGGDIEVSSQEGKGSVFTIKIPTKSNADSL